MFRRRAKNSSLWAIRDFLWPRIGWGRSTTYLMHRLGRLGGTPHAVAAGLACGVAISFTPFVGFHFVLAALVAWVVRANIIASAIGTAAGNPWTFPFIWIWIYEVGIWLGVGPNGGSVDKLDFFTLFGNVMKSLLRLDFAYLAESALPILGPMLVGSIPTLVVVWVVAYLVFKPIVASYQHARRARRERNLRRRQAQAEGSKEMGT